MRLPHNSFVMVADGRKMLFFRNEGDVQAPNLTVVAAEEQDNPADRDQKTDAAGQRPSGMGRGFGGDSTGEVDFHQQEEDRFAASAAEMLKRRALDGEYEALIIVAPPKTLGELRKHYHKEVAQRIKAEIPKDLTSHPVREIEKILVAAE